MVMRSLVQGVEGGLFVLLELDELLFGLDRCFLSLRFSLFCLRKLFNSLLEILVLVFSLFHDSFLNFFNKSWGCGGIGVHDLRRCVTCDVNTLSDLTCWTSKGHQPHKLPVAATDIRSHDLSNWQS